jgi:hypothetical protein
VRSRNFEDHRKYYLSANIYVPHAREIFVASLEYAWWKVDLQRISSHVDYKKNQAKVDELDPAYSSDRLCHNLLLVHRSSELGATLDNGLNWYISDDDQDCNSGNRQHYNNVLRIPLLAMVNVIEREHKIFDTYDSLWCKQVLAETMEVSRSWGDVSKVVNICCSLIYVLRALNIWHLVWCIIHCFFKQENYVEAKDEHEYHKYNVDEESYNFGAVGNSEVFPQKELWLDTSGHLQPLALEHLGLVFLGL